MLFHVAHYKIKSVYVCTCTCLKRRQKQKAIIPSKQNIFPKSSILACGFKSLIFSWVKYDYSSFSATNLQHFASMLRILGKKTHLKNAEKTDFRYKKMYSSYDYVFLEQIQQLILNVHNMHGIKDFDLFFKWYDSKRIIDIDHLLKPKYNFTYLIIHHMYQKSALKTHAI